MERIPISDVKEVILSRERGTWVWLKWALVLAFGIVSMIAVQIGLRLAPDVKPTVIGIAGPIAFAIVGLAMLIDNRWRLVLTIRTKEKNWRWRPNIFDRRDEVKALREGFLDACRFVRVPTRRLDLANESEIRSFWKWFENHAKGSRIDESAVRARLHKLCDRVDVKIKEHGYDGDREMTFTANYARDAFPIVEELVYAAPKVPNLSVVAFRQKRSAEKIYLFGGIEYPLDKVFFVPYSDGFELEIVVYAELENIDADVLWALCQDELGEYEFVVGVQSFHLVHLSDASEDQPLHHISELSDFVEDFHRLDIL
jgi:hypothetical protein